VLTIETVRGREVYVMILDNPVDSVSGICQCKDCDAYAVLRQVDKEKLAIEILEFADRHHCERAFFRSKEELIDIIREQVRKGKYQKL